MVLDGGCLFMGVTLKAPEEHEAEMNIVNIKK